MKVLVAIFFLFVGCQEVINEPVVETFNCTGLWESNPTENPIPLSIYILQEGDKFTADVFSKSAYIGSIENGKIIGSEKYVSFSFKQQSAWGEASMGFNGRFYGNELKGIYSGRIFMQFGVIGVFQNEQYKFTKTQSRDL